MPTDSHRYQTFMGKTFIHHDGALGDLLLSLPAIICIRERSGFVHLAGRADVAAMLLEAGVMDGASSVGSSGYVSLYGDNPSQELRDFLAAFDSSVVFTARSESQAAAGIRRVIPDTRIIRTVPPDGIRAHVGDYRLRQLADGMSVQKPLIAMPAGRLEEARRFLLRRGYDFSRPLISVHPGSGGARKCWPLDGYFSLLKMLDDFCRPFILFISGPVEEGSFSGSLQELLLDNPFRSALMENQALALVAAVLSITDLYLGNDSGISHLAGCLGARSVVLFGPTDHVLWKPFGDDVRVVRGMTECAPCCDERSRGCLERRCLDNIAAEEVFKVAREVLSGGAAPKQG
jgi:ADP-heptose:LPS heptosyltransferase